MKTILEGVTFLAALLAFCGLLAWIESVPLPDSAMEYFVAGASAILDLIAR